MSSACGSSAPVCTPSGKTDGHAENERERERKRSERQCAVSLRSTSNCDVVAGACPRSRFKTASTALPDRFFLAEAGLHPFAFVRACMRVQRLCPFPRAYTGDVSLRTTAHTVSRIRIRMRAQPATGTPTRGRAVYLALASSPAFFRLSVYSSFLVSSLVVLVSLRSFLSLLVARASRTLVSPLSISKRQIVSQSFLLGFNEIIRTAGSNVRPPLCAAGPLYRRLPVESPPFRVSRPLKHRREEFYVRPVSARARETDFFLVVCHRDADLSLSVFLIAPRDGLGALAV